MTRTDEPVRLTSFSPGAGCACKLSPCELHEVMGLLGPFPTSSDLLVGLGNSDDAAVYRVRDDLAMVLTTDFFTPIVDDPRDWGRIAAVNALSDIYAMGATPVMALNLVAWPREALPFELLAQVLEGGAEAASTAGCLVVGGHSIDDPAPKYGMAVVGTVHPDQVLTNAGAQAGDVLVLTKPLGMGAVTTGLKRALAGAEIVAAATELMTTPNAAARDAAAEIGIGGDGPVHAGTDVTGFGLLGHLHEMTEASGCAAEIEVASVPVLAGVRELIDAGAVAGGTERNREWIDASTDWGDRPLTDRLLLADAQTSGGLLLACDATHYDELVDALVRHGAPAAAPIGRITDGPAGHIRLR